MTRVVRTGLARQDLKEISRYLARESGSRDVAWRLLTAIKQKCWLYAGEPELGELCPTLGADVRRFRVSSYVVFYRAVHDGIQVLRVFHTSRDVPAAWWRNV
jgi:toxin ParE1/3/4